VGVLCAAGMFSAARAAAGLYLYDGSSDGSQRCAGFSAVQCSMVNARNFCLLKGLSSRTVHWAVFHANNAIHRVRQLFKRPVYSCGGGEGGNMEEEEGGHGHGGERQCETSDSKTC
jgi:hypothetical protein